MDYLAALSQVENVLQTQIQEVVSEDSQYTKLMVDVQDGVMRKYWLEDGLLCAKGARLFAPKGGQLRQDLLKEHHDVPWAGHPSRERMTALVSCHFYWLDMAMT